MRKNYRRNERGKNERNYGTEMHMKFKGKYQTAQRHRYSKEFAKQAFLQALLQVCRMTNSFVTERFDWINMCSAPGR